MSKYLMVRCNDEVEINAVAGMVLQLMNRVYGGNWKLGDSEDVYYGASDLASDISQVKMITEIEDD